jgi:general secretion pathway protein L
MAMALSLTNQFQQYRLRLHDSRTGQFLRWWGGELRELLPPGWRARLLPPKRAVLFKLTAEELEVGVQESAQQHQIAVMPLSEDARLHQQKLREILVERELLQSPREFLIAEETVLRKEVSMPLAAEAGLNRALAFEMDRQTPFRAEDVYFDCRILRRDREANQVRVELLLTPKDELDEQLAVLRERGLVPSGVDVEIEGRPAGVNLLPLDQRYRVINWRTRFNWLMAGATVLLLAAVMLQSLWVRETQIDAVEQAIESVRSEAMRVQQVRKQITDAQEAAGFLNERRASSVPSVKVLAEVTRLLPDDTYLDRLVIGEDSIQMQGKSRNAQRLIELINQSPYFDGAAFRGPTRLDSRTQREIFDLTASSSPGEEG